MAARLFVRYLGKIATKVMFNIIILTTHQYSVRLSCVNTLFNQILNELCPLTLTKKGLTITLVW